MPSRVWILNTGYHVHGAALLSLTAVMAHRQQQNPADSCIEGTCPCTNLLVAQDRFPPRAAVLTATVAPAAAPQGPAAVPPRRADTCRECPARSRQRHNFAS